MNERIKQLALQSQKVIWSADGNVTELTDLDIEKFAELIVRDTLDQVAEFSRLTKAYQTQGIDPEIDVTREVLKNYGFTRFPRS